MSGLLTPLGQVHAIETHSLNIARAVGVITVRPPKNYRSAGKPRPVLIN